MEAPERRDPETLLANAGWIRALARSLVSDANSADDIAQDTWVAALEHEPSHTRSMRALLATIVRNFARERHRRDARREAREQDIARPEALPSTAETVERFALHRRVVDAVESLDEPYRTAILLRYFDDLPPREIARRLDVSVRTVNTRLSRALEQLRARLDQAHGGDRESWLVTLMPLAREPSTSVPPAGGALAHLVGVGIMSTSIKVAVAIAVLLAVFFFPRGRAPSTSRNTSETAGTIASSIERTEKRVADEIPKARELAIASDDHGRGDALNADADASSSREIRGIVVDGRDQPVAGADVRVYFLPGSTFTYLNSMSMRADSRLVACTRSSASGSFVLALSSAGPFDVRVRDADHAETVEKEISPGRSLRVQLMRGASLSGRVERASDHAPVAGAAVVINDDNEDSSLGPAFEGTTDAAGSFEARGLHPGKILLQVIPERDMRQNVELTLLEGEERVQDVEVEKGPSVSGEVRDARTGRPIAGAEVSSWSFLHKTVRTDAQGRYSLEGIHRWHRSTIEARATGYGKLERTLDTQSLDASVVDFELLPGLCILGRVVSRSGEAVDAAHVLAIAVDSGAVDGPTDSLSARSDSDGRFALKNVRSDVEHVLFVRREGLASTTVALLRTKRSGEMIEVDNIVLAPASSIAGRVTNEHEKPVADAEIFIRARGAGPAGKTDATMRSTTSDDAGRFHFEDIEAGQYSLEFLRKGLRTLKDFEVELGESEARRDVHVVMESRLAITGRVLDPFGKGLPNAEVWVAVGARRQGFPRDDVEADTNEGGAFELDGLTPGAYALHVVPRGWFDVDGERWWLARANLAEIEAGAQDVVVQVARAAVIQGFVHERSGKPAAHAGIVAHDAQGLEVDSTFADADGRFELHVAERSTVDVVAYSSRPDPQTVSGYAPIESEIRASMHGVVAGAAGIDLRFSN
jgi:RNA polymerase sigma-70 factor (ECF subfamily)